VPRTVFHEGAAAVVVEGVASEAATGEEEALPIAVVLLPAVLP